MKRLPLVLAAASVLALSICAHAAEPYRFKGTVTITVPFNAGSNTDMQMRFLQPYLEKHLGTKTIVVNAGGAAGVIGVSGYINQKKNGSNVLFSLPSPTVYKPSTGATPYKVSDLIPVAQVTASPFYLAVSGENEQFKDAASVLAFIKENPGQFTYANAGNGGIAHLAFASFVHGEGLDAISVPFTGGTSDCYTALMGGHVMSHAVSETELVGRSDVRPLINLGTKSSTEGFEDIPTLAELGYDGYVTDTFAGFYYMKGVKDEVVKAFEAAVKATLEDEEFIAAAKAANFKHHYVGAEDFAAKIADTVKAVTPVLQAINK